MYGAPFRPKEEQNYLGTNPYIPIMEDHLRQKDVEIHVWQDLKINSDQFKKKKLFWQRELNFGVKMLIYFLYYLFLIQYTFYFKPIHSGKK